MSHPRKFVSVIHSGATRSLHQCLCHFALVGTYSTGNPEEWAFDEEKFLEAEEQKKKDNTKG
jgi:hypothetical protein